MSFVVREQPGAIEVDIASGYAGALLHFGYVAAPMILLASLLVLVTVGLSPGLATIIALAVIVALAIPFTIRAGPERVIVKEGQLMIRTGFRSLRIPCSDVTGASTTADRRALEIHLRDGRPCSGPDGNVGESNSEAR
jgi:hypothetical protein